VTESLLQSAILDVILLFGKVVEIFFSFQSRITDSNHENQPTGKRNGRIDNLCNRFFSQWAFFFATILPFHEEIRL